MPTPNLQLIFQAVLAVMNNQQSPSVQIATFDLGNPTLPSGATGGTVAFYEQYFQAGIGGTPVNLPVSPVFAIFVQNLSATSNLQVTHTPAGGAASLAVYGPGGVCVLFDPSEAGNGFTALTLGGVGGTVPAMVLVGA